MIKSYSVSWLFFKFHQFLPNAKRQNVSTHELYSLIRQTHLMGSACRQ